MNIPHRGLGHTRRLGTAALLALLGACSRTPGSAGNSGDLRFPTQVIFEFIKESGGTHPSNGAKILLGFDPGGEAYLYALKPGEYVAYHGRWSYQDGHMALNFASSSLTVDARFPLDLAAGRVTLPFQIFAGTPGTSQWRTAPLPVTRGIYATYYAALTDKDHGLPHQEAVRHAFEYAKARIGLEQQQSAASLDAHSWVAGLLPAAMASVRPGKCDSSAIPYQVVQHGDDLILLYRCGPAVTLLLDPIYDNPRQPPLALSPVAGDPRVFIDTRSPGNGRYDPPSKTALIFAPFVDKDRQKTANPFRSLTALSDYLGGSANPAPDPRQFSIEPALEAHGYQPVELINSEATVKNLVKALDENPTPGFVILDSHGSADGLVATADYWLSDAPDNPTVGDGMTDYLRRLRTDGLGGLIDYGRPPNTPEDQWFTTTLGIITISVGADPEQTVEFASLTPTFWEWARKTRHVDLHRSLVYVSACATDATPLLGNAIQAGAYFAWPQRVNADLAAGVARYLAASLSRPTHSAEETYYHLRRIGHQRSMIYVEDALLNGVAGPDASADVGNLRAYGWDGSHLISYSLAGWLGTASQHTQSFEATSVWHLLFAARWSADPQEGATKLIKCLDEVWRPKNVAGTITSPQCTSYNNGTVPSDDEVGYAEYLLSGTVNPSFSGQQVPRWTLDDGAPPRN